MAWSREQRRKAKERAFNEHAQRVLAEPQRHSPLKLKRTAAKLTQKELAALPAVRLHFGTISEIERGVHPGTRNTRARLAFGLEAPESELFPDS
jgi:hypothetical protein